MPSVTTALALLVGLLGGGLAGAVFTWFVNRPPKTVITYSVNTATLAASGQSAGIPNLKVAIGDVPISALYAHSIELRCVKGRFIKSVDVAVRFPRDLKIYGLNTEVPNSLHEIACTNVPRGVRCTLTPISPGVSDGYRVTLATDEAEPPVVEMAADSVELLSVDRFVSSQVWSLRTLFTGRRVAFLVPTVLYLAILFFVRGSFIGSFIRPLIVGKIMSLDGKPINGATVEVVLKSPHVDYAPAQTDSYGDFLVGGGLGPIAPTRKMSLISGRLRIVHPDYAPREEDFHSPIIVETLSPKNLRQ
jgi:hypothetical protein